MVTAFAPPAQAYNYDFTTTATGPNGICPGSDPTNVSNGAYKKYGITVRIVKCITDTMLHVAFYFEGGLTSTTSIFRTINYACYLAIIWYGVMGS